MFSLCTRSPSKSTKKSKAFKFPTKSKEKREKSREKVEVREKDLTEVKDKKKDKDKEKKEKKEKTKEKEKKDKKSKQSSVNEEILELGGKSINIPFSHTHTQFRPIICFNYFFYCSWYSKMRSPYSVYHWDCRFNVAVVMTMWHYHWSFEIASIICRNMVCLMIKFTKLMQSRQEFNI